MGTTGSGDQSDRDLTGRGFVPGESECGGFSGDVHVRDRATDCRDLLRLQEFGTQAAALCSVAAREGGHKIKNRWSLDREQLSRPFVIHQFSNLRISTGAHDQIITMFALGMNLTESRHGRATTSTRSRCNPVRGRQKYIGKNLRFVQRKARNGTSHRLHAPCKRCCVLRTSALPFGSRAE